VFVTEFTSPYSLNTHNGVANLKITTRGHEPSVTDAGSPKKLTYKKCSATIHIGYYPKQITRRFVPA